MPQRFQLRLRQPLLADLLCEILWELQTHGCWSWQERSVDDGAGEGRIRSPIALVTHLPCGSR